MKLCIVTPTHWAWFMGGAQYQIKCLLEELLPSAVFDVTVLSRRVPEGFGSDQYRLIKIGNAAAMPRFGYIQDVVPVYRALKQIRPDVIYQRVGCGYTGIAAAYARSTGARMVWHVAHDNDVMRESLRDGGMWIRRVLEKGALEYGVRNATEVVTQTHHQAELLMRNYHRKAAAVVPNFHPPRKEEIRKGGQITVVWVANFKPWKQPEVFVRLARTLANLDVRFVMVGAEARGQGDRRWNDAILSSIRESPNIEYRGKLSQDTVNQLLSSAHIFVNTSLFEGFANTFIQAWMREVPVVSLNVDPDGILEREKIGFLARNEKGLAELVRTLVMDDDLRQECGRRARSYAEKEHSIRNVQLLADVLLDRAGTGSVPALQ